MNKVIFKIKNKLSRIAQWRPKLYKLPKLDELGTAYGGWTIPSNYLSEDSICYLVGAGEDISFDVALVEKYRCNVHIFDPTPRAKIHFEQLIENTHDNLKTSINNDPSQFYELQNENISLMHYSQLGLWNKSGEVKFYGPKDPTSVSHSALNLQKTKDYFIAKVDRLSEIMKKKKHQYIDLLKIDVEGAEYAVIDSILEDDLQVNILSVEYDEANNAMDRNFLKRIRQSIEKLIDYGYKVVYADSNHNYTFVRDHVYDELTFKNLEKAQA